jgi:hypothetical protein
MGARRALEAGWPASDAQAQAAEVKELVLGFVVGVLIGLVGGTVWFYWTFKDAFRR